MVRSLARFESKKIVLTRKLNNVIYELLVKTCSDMVYVNSNVTLTEVLSDFADRFINLDGRTTTLEEEFSDLVEDAPETFRTFKEVWDYVNVDGDPKSALIELIDSKVEKEEGKGLSTHDLTDILYEKLSNDYTKEELNEKFQIIIEDIDAAKQEVEQNAKNYTDETTQALAIEIQEKIDEVNEEIEEIKNTPNMVVSYDEPIPLPEYGCYMKIISVDEGE